MQTSALSKKWKPVWTLIPQLNIDSCMFSNNSRFNKFVKHVLLLCNNHKEFSVLVLKFSGAATQSTVKSILNYVSLHNVRRMSIVWSLCTKYQEFAPLLFNCRALKDLTIRVKYGFPRISESGWEFPALEKLNLRNFKLDAGGNRHINLFSKCVKLKDLTLHDIDIDFSLKEINLCVPQLYNLSVTFDSWEPNVLNVVTPQLQNLTASVDIVDVLRSETGFDSLVKVNLSLPSICSGFTMEKHLYLSQLLGVFKKIYNAKILILDAFIIRVLKSCLDQLLLKPCPFNNLKCLKMNTIVEKKYSGGGTIREDVPLELKNYFLDKSPSTTFITDYPKVAKKKPKQKVHDDNISIPKQKGLSEAKLPIQDQVTSKQNEIFEAQIGIQDKQVHDDDAPAKKKAKLDVQKQPPDTTDANIQMQDEGTTKQDSMFEAKLQMQDQTFLQQKEMFEAHIQMQDQVIIKQNTMFEVKIKMQDQVILKQEEMFEAKLKMQEQVCTNRKALFEAKIQMQEQVYTNQKAMLEAKLQMQDHVITEQNAKLQMQDNVIAEQKAKLQIQDDVIAEEKEEIDILEGSKFDHEKLMPYVIKSKLVDLQVQVESRNPNYEVVRSIGSEMKSVMELVPEKLRAVVNAEFSYRYVEWKSLFLTQIDASQWAKIETELGIIDGL